MTMKIAIVVQGRFHSFDLARALIERGHDVTVFTNYPRQAVPRFGLAPSRIRSFPAHGVLSRVVAATRSPVIGRHFEAYGHQLFGRWAAETLAGERWDAIHCWSGVAEETLRAPIPAPAVRVLMRGSAHIAVQRQLLREEEVRVGQPLEQPSDWMVARELREYELADHIVVLSRFARQSFVECGVPSEKLTVLPLGVRVETFRPTPDAAAARQARIRQGEPLTVLYVGNLSYQKGLWDLAQVISSTDRTRFRFVLVGKVLPEAERLVRSLPRDVAVLGKVPQFRLPEVYARGDVFLFPTVQDGFAAVLAQAKAAGLPIITTPNSAGVDIVTSEADGWIVPARDAAAMVERLAWCDAHREALAARIGAGDVGSRSWAAVAEDFEQLVVRLQRGRATARVAAQAVRPAPGAASRGRRLKIAVVVHGRFHAFDLARGLIERGHDLTVFTNYPKRAAARFGLPAGRVRSFSMHGVLGRAVAATRSAALGRGFEAYGHPLFGRWAAGEVAREPWDVVHCWSGVAEETLRAEVPSSPLRLLVRGSSHIAVQRRLLREEEARVSVPLDQPSDWIVEREIREYGLADHLIVLSSFARDSFIEQGIDPAKISRLSLGVRVEAFRPSPAAVAARAARVRRGDRLRVLFVGALSYRKGLWDLAQVIASLDPARFEFELVGKIFPEAEDLAGSLGPEVRIPGKVAQSELPRHYEQGDVFLFPTIEDGFAVVLAQAKAAGLPIITTPNGAGYDLVQSERDGWVVPIRDADAMVARLRWCDEHRAALAAMVDAGGTEIRSRSWTDVAAEYEEIVRARLAAGSRGVFAHAG